MDSRKLDDEAIFRIACKINDPEARSEYLDQVCSAEPNLRLRVEALLAGYEKERKHSSDPGPTIDPHVPAHPGSQVGPYKLLEKIAEGGMGTVFMAEQLQPMSRRVAIKIVKPDRETPGTLARFDAERHALAMMDHPNIARVLDAGTTESGRPYFVMELVKGIPINKYCDEHRLTVNERLELFVDVCHAVQHAHQKGVIHRDLKPSNILVAEYDDRPVPKVIDFGVAKALGQKLTDLTMFTGFGEIIGTLEYMSPEQAKFNQQDVDTRSDIYALGVVLYELLTSQTPFDQQRLRAASIDEAVRIIRDEEPVRPSLRLSSTATLASIAAQRRIEPKRLGSLVRGELDWIVMKALDKERTRRYDTAAAFGEDVERFLHNEQITARPPTLAYTLRKLARRHRVALGVLSSIMLVLVLSTCVASWLAMRLNDSLAAEKVQREIAEDRSVKLRETTDDLSTKTNDLRENSNALRRKNYAFAMESAFRAWQVGSLAQLQEMLTSQVPTENGEDLRGFEWRFLDARCKENLPTPLFETSSPVRSVAYSPTGEYLAVTLDTGDLLLHQLSSGRTDILNKGDGASGEKFGTDIAFSPSGDFLVGRGTSHREVYLWRTTPDKAAPFSRDENITIQHKVGVCSVAVSPDGRFVASASGDSTTLVWDASTAEVRQTLAGDCATFAAEGRLLLTSNWQERSLTLWDLATGDRLDTHNVGEQPTILGRLGPLAAVGDSSGVHFWNLEENTLAERASELSWRRAAQVSMSPNGSDYAVADLDDAAVRVYDVRTRQQLVRFLHKGRVNTVHFSPDGKSLAAGGVDQVVREWKLEPRRRRIFRGIANWIAPAAISHDSRTIATAGMGGCVQIWDIETGAMRSTNGGGVVWSIVFSPDGKTLASANDGQTFRLWDAATGDCICTFSNNAIGVGCVAFAADGRWLASGGQDSLQVWDVKSSSLHRRLDREGTLFHSASFSPDNRLLVAAAFNEKKAVVWDVQSDTIVKEFPFDSNVLCVTFSPNGENFAIAGRSDRVDVWDVSTWSKRYTLSANGSWLTSIAYSPDGKSLVAASPAGEIRFWRAATGEPTGSLTVERGTRRAFFAPDGNGIVWASMDGTVEYWSATPVEEIPGFGSQPKK